MDVMWRLLHTYSMSTINAQQSMYRSMQELFVPSFSLSHPRSKLHIQSADYVTRRHIT